MATIMAAANKDFLIFHPPVCTLEKCEGGSFVPREIDMDEGTFLRLVRERDRGRRRRTMSSHPLLDGGTTGKVIWVGRRNTPGIGESPTKGFVTRKSAMIAVWLVVIE